MKMWYGLFGSYALFMLSEKGILKWELKFSTAGI